MRQDLCDISVTLGDQLLLHPPELRLHLLVSHGGGGKRLDLFQKVLDQNFPFLEKKEGQAEDESHGL